MVIINDGCKALLSSWGSPTGKSVIELLVSYDEYEKEREEATENVDDDEEDHERRKIFLEMVTS